MKLIIALTLVTLAVVAATPEEPPIFKILRSEFDQEPAGGYKYAFETENGIVRDEVGDLKVLKDEDGKDQEVVVIRGSYSYTDPTGQLISVKYVADETGFHAEGDHIPKPDARR